MRYIIQYTLPYEHRVMVGIEAESREAAIAKAGELFDQGDIWQDSADVPLLSDDFEEQGDAGVPLEASKEAVHRNCAELRKRCVRLAIVIEGGLVQAVVSNQPDVAPSVAVIDYDTDGFEAEDLCHITQSDGSNAKVLVVEHCVETAAIDLDEVFQEAES